MQTGFSIVLEMINGPGRGRNDTESGKMCHCGYESDPLASRDYQSTDEARITSVTDYPSDSASINTLRPNPITNASKN